MILTLNRSIDRICEYLRHMLKETNLLGGHVYRRPVEADLAKLILSRIANNMVQLLDFNIHPNVLELAAPFVYLDIPEFAALAVYLDILELAALVTERLLCQIPALVTERLLCQVPALVTEDLLLQVITLLSERPGLGLESIISRIKSKCLILDGLSDLARLNRIFIANRHGRNSGLMLLRINLYIPAD